MMDGEYFISSEIIQAGITVILAIVGAIGGGGFVAWMHRKKTAAEAGNLNVTGSMKIVDRTMEWNAALLEERKENLRLISEMENKWETRFLKLELEIKQLEEENDALRGRCRKLELEKREMEKRIKEI